MRKSVEGTYPQLWHYTTAIGLHGILTSHQLWATDIFYLNDADEFKGLFDKKLLCILKEGVRKGIDDTLKCKGGLSHINSLGGAEELENKFSAELLNNIRTATHQLQAYVTSFSSPSKQDSENGLLSQWRGYGKDGGYAIVFDSLELQKLLDEEQKKYFYSFIHWGDVDYYGDSSSTHEELLEWEQSVRDTAASLLFETTPKSFEEKVAGFFEPILCMSTRHKHRGFQEEAEVRIAAFTSVNDKVPEDAREQGELRLEKPVCFRPNNGTLVPYIPLFGSSKGEGSRLPIKKIIVGPHPDKLNRKKSIEKLLEQLNIKVPVVMSEIPYLGM